MRQAHDLSSHSGRGNSGVDETDLRVGRPSGGGGEQSGLTPGSGTEVHRLWRHAEGAFIPAVEDDMQGPLVRISDGCKQPV